MSVKKNFLFNLLLNVSNIIFPVLTIPYVSRVLGVEVIGQFNFVITVTSYFILLAALGTPLYGVREIAKVKHNHTLINKIFNEVFSINLISSLVFSFIFLFLIFFVNEFKATWTLYLVSGLGVLFSFLNLDWFFSGVENFKIIAIRSLLVKVLNLCALFFFVKEPDDLIIYVLIYTLSMLMNQFWNVFGLKRYSIRLQFTTKDLLKHLSPLTTLFFSAIAIQFYMLIDTVIIGFLMDYKSVGIYSSAMKSVRLVMPIITSLGVVLLPRIASFKAEDGLKRQDLLNRSFEVINFLSIPIALFFVLIAERFVPLFFGSGYEDAIKPMKLLSILIFVGNLSYFFSVQTLAMLGYEKLFMRSVFLGTVLNVILNFIFIPYLGVIGAAVASISAELGLIVLSAYYLFKVLNISISFRSVFQGIIAVMPAFFIDYFIYPISNNILYIIIFGLIFAIQYFAIQFCIFKNPVLGLLIQRNKY